MIRDKHSKIPPKLYATNIGRISMNFAEQSNYVAPDEVSLSILADSVENAEIKRMPIDEFRRLGYLQELNRQFLHPLGLALEVVINSTGTEFLGGIHDYREDAEGIHYGLSGSGEDRKAMFAKKRDYVESERKSRAAARIDALGFLIEPV